MAAHKRRFCPRGHDKDAPGAVLIYKGFTTKGTPKIYRDCRECARQRKRKQLRLF